MSEESDSNIIVEKLERWLQNKFPYLFLDHNEYGTQAVLLLEGMKSIEPLYGEYSEMKPYVSQMNSALESGVLSTSSIGGKTRTAFLVKRVALTQNTNFLDPNANKGGMLDGFGGLFGGKPKQQNPQGFG